MVLRDPQDAVKLKRLHARIRACTKCVAAGYLDAAAPVVAGSMTDRVMIVGQAPGIVELTTRTPFSGRASLVMVVMSAYMLRYSRKMDQSVFAALGRRACGAETSGPPSVRPSIEIARQDQLQGNSVRRVGQSESHTSLDLQALGVMIDDSVKVMSLLIAGVELV